MRLEIVLTFEEQISRLIAVFDKNRIKMEPIKQTTYNYTNKQ